MWATPFSDCLLALVTETREKNMIVGLHHVAVGVSDIDRALKFYTEGLGFEVVQRDDFENDDNANRTIGLKDIKARMAMLKTHNAFVELWEYSNPAPQDKRSSPCDYGYPHFALQVDNIQEEYDRLQTHGMEFVGEVVHFGDSASAIYGRDPFGNVIELFEIKSTEIAQLSR
jgi:glyoxylase I family protein